MASDLKRSLQIFVVFGDLVRGYLEQVIIIVPQIVFWTISNKADLVLEWPVCIFFVFEDPFNEKLWFFFLFFPCWSCRCTLALSWLAFISGKRCRLSPSSLVLRLSPF